MPYGLYMAAEGAQVQSQILEVLSNNIANVETAGFKRDLAVAQARHSESIERGLTPPGSRGIDDIGGGVLTRETTTQFAPGPLQVTGNRTDLAIDGDGFFQVKKGDETFLTRAGNFRIDNDGQLITQTGHQVLDSGGGPLVLDPSLNWDVDNRGRIIQGGAPIGQFALVKPESLGDLVKVGDTMFSALSDVTPVAPRERNVRSGYLELSGVKPTQEMMELIKTSRAFEANVKMIQTHDDMIGSLLSRVLAK
ncbi:MAG: flagellar basal-body rod protein FlgF [Planctomycetota bacterium]|nr:MAG: flagellar basal-body rod protein FlgF [Planctomycetota bacterium]REJ87088.1 MAG: flagellar basal-body rod protein FlgF [Planctomycetota bacterium]REK26994.1 MAG: flagellar basal-body rod protein FlgF [Planctomycetota bacterium]REK47279.1 MAG: flagellar basal-body rod protein FlgF [Planctomycetota bacterium]